MAKYLVKRTVVVLGVVLLVACTTLSLVNAAAEKPWLSEKSPPQSVIDALNEKYGLDKPATVQRGGYLDNLLQGDVGYSIK